MCITGSSSMRGSLASGGCGESHRCPPGLAWPWGAERVCLVVAHVTRAMGWYEMGASTPVEFHVRSVC
jgi:hypothetical protein